MSAQNFDFFCFTFLPSTDPLEGTISSTNPLRGLCGVLSISMPLCRRGSLKAAPWGLPAIFQQPLPKVLGLPSLFKQFFRRYGAFQTSFNNPFHVYGPFQASSNNPFRGAPLNLIEVHRSTGRVSLKKFCLSEREEGCVCV